jgi:glycerol-3-phosphate acyltransferase PlsY
MLAHPLDWAFFAGMLLTGYLVGAIPFGLLIGLARGTDIRKYGSGNIGATNAGRVLGKKWGLVVFALDVLKGLIPVLLAGYLIKIGLFSQPMDASLIAAQLIWLSVAAACVLGHMFPVYLRFSGGKGVATALGVLLGIYPYYTSAGLIALTVWGVVVMISRYVSLASIVAVIVFPVIVAVSIQIRASEWGGWSSLWPIQAFAIVVAGLVVYRHRGNIARLLAGQENKIGASAGREDASGLTDATTSKHRESA